MIKVLKRSDGFHYVNAARTMDKKYVARLYKKSVNDEYLCNWVAQQDVMLLTLDGTYGGSDGREFDRYSSDITAQDDYHIGKKYGMESYFRYPIYLYTDEDGHVRIKFEPFMNTQYVNDNNGFRAFYNAKKNEEHNAYLVLSKRTIRSSSKELKKAKADTIFSIADNMMGNFVRDFECISFGEVFALQCVRQDDTPDEEEYLMEDLLGITPPCGNCEKTIEYLLKRIPFTDEIFKTIINELIYEQYDIILLN